MRPSRPSAFLCRQLKVCGSTDVSVADGGSTIVAVDDSSKSVPGPLKSGPKILPPNIPPWAEAQVSAGRCSSTNVHERLEQRSLNIQGAAVRRACRLEPSTSRP